MENDIFLIKEISKELKISMHSIQKVSDYLGIQKFIKNRNFYIDKDSYLKLKEFYKTHLSLDRLCKKYNIGIYWIQHHIKENKIKFEPLVIDKFYFYDESNENILKEHLKEYKYQPQDKNKLTKFTFIVFMWIFRCVKVCLKN